MAEDKYRLQRNRKLTISSLTPPLPPGRSIQSPFVTLLPAYNASERQHAEATAKELINLGCVEFCCVGPESELLHDTLDVIVEAEGKFDIVTTWIEDPVAAGEYFLHAAAAGGRANLLALVEAHPEIQAMLKNGGSM